VPKEYVKDMGDMGSSTTAAQLGAIGLGLLSGTVMIAVLAVLPHLLKRRYLAKQGVKSAAPVAAPPVAATPSEAAPLSSLTPVTQAFIAQELSYALAAIMLSFFLALTTLFLYRALAPTTFVWFGVTEVLWYLLGFFVYTLRKIVRDKKLRES
jgi:hypothetical protein